MDLARVCFIQQNTQFDVQAIERTREKEHEQQQKKTEPFNNSFYGL